MQEPFQNNRSTDATILMPVFNDWQCLRLLLPDLDRALDTAGLTATVTIVNDGSIEKCPDDLLQGDFRRLRQVEVLDLVCNLGHQRAIAVGLTYLAKSPDDGVVVVMDSDGEDKPEDVPRLIRYLMDTPEKEVVFAERLRRSESVLFQTGYAAYRLMHWLLTGIRIRFGNFSAVKMIAVRKLVYSGSLWNHYAAAVVRSRLRYDMMPTSRGRRYQGSSRLNVSQLTAHGLSALSVFSDIICGRLFALAVVAVVTFMAGLGALWSTERLAAADAAMFVAMAALIFFTFILSVMALIAVRSFPSFIPARDAGAFIEAVRRVGSRQASL